jgi:hypothetical protein
MGFRYVPDAGKTGYFMAVATNWSNWMVGQNRRELAYYEDLSPSNDRRNETQANQKYGIRFKYDKKTGGPLFNIENFSGEL